MEKIRIIDAYLDEFEDVLEKMFEKKLNEALANKGRGDELLTRAEVIKRLQIAPSTLADYTNKKILTSYKIGHRVFYKWSEILDGGIRVDK